MKTINKNISNNTFCTLLLELIKYEFPGIENLDIKSGEGDDLVISFNDGIYTKEEVENKLEEVRNYNFDIKQLKNVIINETPFGIKITNVVNLNQGDHEAHK